MSKLHLQLPCNICKENEQQLFAAMIVARAKTGIFLTFCMNCGFIEYEVQGEVIFNMQKILETWYDQG